MAEEPEVYTSSRGSVRVWRCCVCGRLFEWADKPEADWYGSERDIDDGRWHKITVVCSAACKARLGQPKKPKRLAKQTATRSGLRLRIINGD